MGLESAASNAVAFCSCSRVHAWQPAAVLPDLGSLHKFVCSSSAAQKGLIMTGCYRMCMSMSRGS